MINLIRRILTPDWAKSSDGGTLGQIRDLWDSINNPLVTIEYLEEIEEERYVPLGDDGVSLVHPEFEQFDDPLGFLIDLLTGGLLEFSPEIHIAWNECEIFISIEGKISIYEISADKHSGGGISFRRNTPECRRKKEELPQPPDIPPPPKLPPPGTICCEGRPPRKYGIWYTNSGAKCNRGSTQKYYLEESIFGASGRCRYLYRRERTYRIRYSSTTQYTEYWTWIDLPLDRKRWNDFILSLEGRSSSQGLNAKDFIYTTGTAQCYQNGIYQGPGITWGSQERIFGYYFDDNKFSCLNGEPPEKTPDPPPPPNDEDDEMKCCKNSKDSEELLKRIAKAVGVGDLPLSTPKSFIRGKDSYIQLQSLAQIQNHILEQIDAIAGEFPIEIEIKDADPSKKGDQKKKVKLPNIAESLAEMYGLIFEADSYIGTIVDYLTRLAVEMLSVKAGVAKNLAYHQAVTEFLGFRTNMRYKTVKTAFDPWRVRNTEKGGKKSQMYLEYIQNADSETLKDYLTRLMYSASIIKNAFMKDEDDLEKWKKLAADAEAQLRNKKDKDGKEIDPDEVWNEFIKYLNRDGFVNRSPGGIEPKAREIPVKNPIRPDSQ